MNIFPEGKVWNPYPAYYDCDVEWLGELPEGWVVKPLKFVCTCNDETLSATTEEDHRFEYIDISSVSLIGGIQNTEEINFGQAPSRARRIVRQGDIIISTVRTYLKSIASIDFDASNIIVSTGFAVLRPTNETYPGFIDYFIQSNRFINDVCAKSTGINYPTINVSKLISINIAIPSFSEQKAITSFLNHQCSRINAFIEGKRRLLDLLQEKRRAIITQTVTHGLDPTVPMKYSGVAWLGDVPEAWAIERMCVHVSNISKKSSDIDSGIPFIALEHIESWTGRVIVDTALESKYNANLYQIHDVLFGKLRPYLAKVHLAKSNGACSTELYVLRPDNHITPDFLHMFLLSKNNIDLITASAYGVKMPRANWAFIRDLPLPVPSMPEQQAITSFLGRECAVIDAQRRAQEKAIDLLQEYRSTLITNAVTGKIDVRDYDRN